MKDNSIVFDIYMYNIVQGHTVYFYMRGAVGPRPFGEKHLLITIVVEKLLS